MGNLIRSIFRIGKRTPQKHSNNQTSSSQTNGSYSSTQSSTASSYNGKKKIFAEDEGEYVEYEEVN